MPPAPEIDAFVIAPDADECRTRGWLDAATATAAMRLSREGIVCAAVDPRWRGRVRNLLRDGGLVVGTSYLHARHGADADILVPCTTRAARYLASVLPMRPTNRRAWSLAWSVPIGEALVPRLARDIVVVAQRPGARSLADWTRPGAPLVESSADPLVRLRTNGDGGSALIAHFGSMSDAPGLHVKVALCGGQRPSREAAALARLGGSAVRAGAAVPDSHVSQGPNGRWQLRLTTLPGQPAVMRLREHPGELMDVLSRIRTWLAAWARHTRRPGTATGDRLRREVLDPAVEMATDLAGGTAYVSWLRTLCGHAAGAPLPSVATHGDLTMSNVLLAPDGGLGVLDWESARDDGLPLTDVVYAAADAVAACEDYRDRRAAFASCLDTTTPVGRWFADTLDTMASDCGLSAEMRTLLVHATVLHHAVNERRAAGGPDRPFMAMAQHLCYGTRAGGAAR